MLVITLVCFVTGGVISAFWTGEVDIYALWASALCCALLGLSSVAYHHRQKSTIRA